jgi:hypothetical protein
MTYKLFTDKSSILKKYSRQLQGGTIDINTNSLGWWERRLDIEQNRYDDLIIIIPMEYNKRPDKVAYQFYGREDLEWLVVMYNNIVDINEEFITGSTIRLANPSRISEEILTSSIKNQPL